ncbi:hypothetical protein B0H14DRAFT_3515705 [Mycena olivaceomarginata]|nr:hypothetical protein B0H14DRAFT_3515705 [Mycena olivaceomarginata]
MSLPYATPACRLGLGALAPHSFLHVIAKPPTCLCATSQAHSGLGSLYVPPACSSLRCRGSCSCIGLSSFSALSASASILEGSGGPCAYGSGLRTGTLVRTCFEYGPRVDNGTQHYHPGA